ncbi:hypothetical protein NQ317_005273 [Molorchus minor]|uniref:Uncharacterized protein n=1 Tax=Molorchus minor TaxID=1323400 RepID=A0ABQ9JX93_9CUCU|nr:hypothetical protein NQ317_005273 [Molorchus minor]
MLPGLDPGAPENSAPMFMNSIFETVFLGHRVFYVCYGYKIVDGQSFFEDFAFAGAAPFLNRHICSDHFKNTDLLDPNDPNSGLLPQAVPNLNFIVFKTEVKEEPLDTGYDDSLAKTLISDPELISEIKLEKLENDNCDELNTNFSFSSNDESCNDLLRVKLDGGIEVYKETEEDKQLSNEFFRKYENAVTCRWRTKTQHHPDGDKATR